MNPKHWIPELPLFGKLMCIYCGGVADTSDHTPPRCLLPRRLPSDLQAMTVPACSSCNASYSADEQRAAAIVSTISFTREDRKAVAEGGWLYSALQRDKVLKNFIADRLAPDGMFRVDRALVETLTHVFKKTAVGLLYFEFGRLIHAEDLSVIAFEHAKNIHPLAFVELYRRDDAAWSEVTPSGRELERQVLAVCGMIPKYMPGWRVYIPEFFEYMFLRRSNKMLLCAMKIHDALTVLLECPWPTSAGSCRQRRLQKGSLHEQAIQ